MLGQAKRLGLAVALAAVAGLAMPGGATASDTVWVCKPGMPGNVCERDRTTTVKKPDGTSRVVASRVPKRRPIDCFYVYPTVSNQVGPNATRALDPEVKAIALYQASRFSRQCKVYAPVYRQATLLSIFTGGITQQVRETAYADVRAAWKDYLRNHNRGRGVVLIGHSQGTGMLRLLMRREIDRKRWVRKRLVSALLLGGNVLVRKGSDRGGDFRRIPACTAPAQIGCVVAYSTFNAPVPAGARFGRVPAGRDPLTGFPGGPGYEVLCTNPAALQGNSLSPLISLVPTRPFPLGLISLGIVQTYGGLPPTAPTPWVRPADRYAGRCERSNGAHVLMVRRLGGARRLNPSPTPEWGLHLVDVNGALGDLQRVVRIQAAAYRKRVSRR